MATTDISVDGEDGSLVARRLGIRVVPQNDHLALARVGTANRDGQHGTHAPSATPGAPAGYLAVDLSESAQVREGIHVQVIRSTGMQQPPQQLEVLIGRDLKLSAIGGKGESGHAGGDGQAGMKGADGAPATREVDATPGMNGGNGGDAGRGSNGADGGVGGTIEISVDEDNTHLLFAVQCNVSGGDGGAPGHHGKPGREGVRGIGGARYQWKELVGYKYVCTNSCLGPVTSTNETAMITVGSKLGGSTTALVSSMRGEIVQGGDLQRLVASAALAYGARRQQAVDPGFCHCRGGQGNCPGCDAKPIYKDFQRVAAFDGRDGKPGVMITDPLFPGERGPLGVASIFVRYHDGTTSRYDRRYQLELVDFAIEDENGDGIFEPGEHILIRHIRVRNTGGMPSPKALIPISVASSKDLVPVAGDEGMAFIPGLIEPGITVTLDETIKVLIPLVDEVQPPGSRFFRTTEVALQASMPWLNRVLPFFEFSQTVNIQYPVELRNFTYLPTMALGSRNRYSYEVFNKSAKAIGASSGYDRIVETEMSFPIDCGSLKSQEDAWIDRVERQVPNIPAKDATVCDETVRIGIKAPNYRRVKLQITLYLSVPHHGNVSHGDRTVEIQAIERIDLEIQLASYHKFNPASRFLLVTNPETTRNRVQAIQDFVNHELGMQMDEWNVGLYGGFRRQSNADDNSYNVLALYKNKTILLLDNKFNFCSSGRRCVSELCDPILLAEIGMAATSFVFLDCSDKQVFNTLAKTAGLPVSLKSDMILSHRRNTQTFDSESALLESIKQEISIGAATKEIKIYTIPIKPPKHSLLQWTNPNSRVERIKRHLQHHLPQERFLVTGIQTDSDDAQWQNFLAVLHGLQHSVNIIALEPRPSHKHISKFESFAIASSLPVSDGLNLVWPSYDAQEAASLSLASLSLLLRLNSEIQMFIRKNPWPNKIRIPKNPQSSDNDLRSFFRIHFPTLFALLIHGKPEQRIHKELSPEYLKILAYAVASSRPQKKRHIVGSVTLPISNRRRQLYQCLLVSVGKFLPNVDVEKFHADICSLHSLRNKEGKRDTTAVLTRLISEFTQQSTHQFCQAQTSARDILPKTEACSADEWDRRWSQSKAVQARTEAETEAARTMLRNMNLEDDSGDVVEIPG